jgi:transcriptional regulator with XRE-family HTH domain
MPVGSCPPPVLRIILGNMGYAEKMQRVCALKGLDQSSLAESLGLSRSTISRIFSGTQEPKLGMAWGIARALGVSLDFLADDALSADPGGTWTRLTDDELTILKLVRRLGPETAMDRLLAVPGGANGRDVPSSPESPRER